MRKCIAIVLMIIYLFNLAGYTWLFDYLSYRLNRQTVQQLDDNRYNEAELVELKVPLYLPYFQSWPDYERFDGEIELNGIHYNFVKRKVVNDTLYMLCLPDFVKTELAKAKTRYSTGDSDKESSPASRHGNEARGKPVAIDAEYNNQLPLFYYLPFTVHTVKTTFFSAVLVSCYIASPVKPPELLA